VCQLEVVTDDIAFIDTFYFRIPRLVVDSVVANILSLRTSSIFPKPPDLFNIRNRGIQWALTLVEPAGCPILCRCSECSKICHVHECHSKR